MWAEVSSSIVVILGRGCPVAFSRRGERRTGVDEMVGGVGMVRGERQVSDAGGNDHATWRRGQWTARESLGEVGRVRGMMVTRDRSWHGEGRAGQDQQLRRSRRRWGQMEWAGHEESSLY